jgi:sugar O-acyltransferase (sialic acid O-acetyltransferase NeuD family)
MKILIYGNGKFAEYVSYVISNDSRYTVCAFCVEKEFLNESKKNYRGIQIVDFENVETLFPPTKYRLFIAIGNNNIRERIFTVSKNKGYTLISYLSSKAEFWEDLKYGENVFLGEGSTIQPFVSIGYNTILFGAKIGHHSHIGNNVLLSSCHLGGNVNIGDNSFLGLNSTVKQNIVIGQSNIIGMGSIIEKDTSDNEIYHNGKSTKKRSMSSDKFNNKYLN